MINLPKEFISDMRELLGDESQAFLDSYNLPSDKGLRLNQLKVGDTIGLPFNLTPIPWCNTGYYYSEPDQPGKHILHEIGLYYIQEPSAMAVAEELDIHEGDIVLDLCAAPGGKSSQIAAKLNGKGLLISNEIIKSRAQILSSNIERMGIKNAIVLNEEPKNIAKHFQCFFNKILVDAPCSGEGMFRKNPEAIGEWSEENVDMCASRQLDILEEAAKCLASGGRLVYSTCTFSTKENEGTICEFVERHPEFTLIKMERLYPHKIKGEGHFFAVLEKDGDCTQTSSLSSKEIKQNPDFVKFVKDTLNVDIKYNLVFGDNLYLSPYTKLDGLKVVRPGLHLGELKKNRFEPSHSLALALTKEDFKNTQEISESEATQFIQGLTIDTDKVGWGVACINGYPIGWFKGDGRVGKNHYPKGLRKDL